MKCNEFLKGTPKNMEAYAVALAPVPDCRYNTNRIVMPVIGGMPDESQQRLTPCVCVNMK